MIGKMIKYRLSDFWKIAIIEWAGFLFGTILFTIIMLLGDGEDVFEFGTAIMAILVVFIVLFMGGMGLQSEFNLLVGMGVTRKQFTIGYFISSMILTTFEMAFVYMAHFIESWKLDLFYGEIEKTIGIEPFLFSWYVIPAILLVVGLGMLVGVIVARVGKKALVVLWILWMAMCFLPSQVTDAVKSESNSILGHFGRWVVRFAEGFTPTVGVVVMAVVIVVSISVSALLLRKQRVTL